MLPGGACCKVSSGTGRARTCIQPFKGHSATDKPGVLVWLAVSQPFGLTSYAGRSFEIPSQKSVNLRHSVGVKPFLQGILVGAGLEPAFSGCLPSVLPVGRPAQNSAVEPLGAAAHPSLSVLKIPARYGGADLTKTCGVTPTDGCPFSDFNYRLSANKIPQGCTDPMDVKSCR